jgi:integrase
VHDLRHGFAIRTLLGWYREGTDVEKKLSALSTYLGHACVRDTYWGTSKNSAGADRANQIRVFPDD